MAWSRPRKVRCSGSGRSQYRRSMLRTAEQTGASSATISRVNRSLRYGEDGYAIVLKGCVNSRNEPIYTACSAVRQPDR